MNLEVTQSICIIRIDSITCYQGKMWSRCWILAQMLLFLSWNLMRCWRKCRNKWRIDRNWDRIRWDCSWITAWQRSGTLTRSWRNIEVIIIWLRRSWLKILETKNLLIWRVELRQGEEEVGHQLDHSIELFQSTQLPEWAKWKNIKKRWKRF